MKPGQQVGPFDIEKQIGFGAMGAVYQARYRKNGKKVAIKVMHAGMDGNTTAMARFEREWEMLKQLAHRNIVQFYVANHFEGVPYYAMEFIEGEPLSDILERRGRMPWEEVVEMGRQICAALQHAHDQGIVHRDIKPSNLMITRDGTIKLTDFGIAKDLDVTQLTAANCTVGTASYMSPEQSGASAI
jgi:serine/threonine protein kinase